MDVRLLIVFDFFFLSSNCPFFLIFSFSSLVAIRNNSKKTPSQSRIRGSLNVTGLCSVNWDYDMMFREKLLEMEFLAVAFYEMAFLKRKDISIPTSVLEQMCSLFEALDDARKSEGDPQL